jgi:hypothetical protein
MIFTLLNLKLINDRSVLILFFKEEETLNASYAFHLDSLPVAFGSKSWMSINGEAARVLLN